MFERTRAFVITVEIDDSTVVPLFDVVVSDRVVVRIDVVGAVTIIVVGDVDAIDNDVDGGIFVVNTILVVVPVVVVVVGVVVAAAVVLVVDCVFVVKITCQNGNDQRQAAK